VTCPYCGASLKRRISIAVFGVLAIVLAIGGLALLWYTATHTDAPTVRIGQIQAAMNYAYVRIEGIVQRGPKFNPDSQSLTFWVDDAGQQMLVTAFRSEAQTLIKAGRAPSVGDRVSVAGVLRVRDDAPSLVINSIDSLALTRATDSATARDLGSITASDALTGVAVRGQVRAVRDPYAGLRLITLRDASGQIDVAIDHSIETFGGPAPEVQVGQTVEVTGVVTLFEEAPQITLTRGEHMRSSNAAIDIAAMVPIRGLGDAVGTWARVQGIISRIAPFSAGMRFTLTDAQGATITLLMWQNVFDSLPNPDDWEIGAEIVAQGQVNSYLGSLEIVPEISSDVALVTRAAPLVASTPGTDTTGTIASSLSLIRIGAIASSAIGKTVFISGTVQSINPLSNGIRVRLKDDSGSILVVLFNNVFDQIEDSDQLVVGVSLSALGQVSEFQGVLEVIPPNGASVHLPPGPEVTPTPAPARASATPQPTPVLTESVPATSTPAIAPTPTVAPTTAHTPTVTGTVVATPAPGSVTSIDSIDKSMIGQAITVRGQVVATGSFKEGFSFRLNDGSGSIALILFDGHYRELANQADLNLGARVTVKAVVVEFQGDLELQPASGGDVIVEQPGSSSIVTTRAINTLSASDIGSLAAVVGDVLRVEGFSAGVRVFVNDGSGEVMVVIFSNVLNYVPNAPSMQAGAKVRVAGRIDQFNGALEIVPALGYDVTVNP
jgi:DNA/RNA endonuclease YhcR with UshA esterase domain